VRKATRHFRPRHTAARRDDIADVIKNDHIAVITAIDPQVRPTRQQCQGVRF
jgi:hypothetical protein